MSKLNLLIIKVIDDNKLELTKIKYILLVNIDIDERLLTIPSIGVYTSRAQMFGKQNLKDIVNVNNINY